MPIYNNVLQIKVALKDFKPTIFRTFYFSGGSDFVELHAAIQETMSWNSSHLFAFRKGEDLEIGIPNELHDDFGFEILDMTLIPISYFLKNPKDTIIYEYDFGDGWEHKVDVQKVFNSIELPQLPYCIKGANACPIEDCGGVWGYQNILEIMLDKKHPEYKEMNSYYNFKKLKPFEFDIEELNYQLLDFKAAISYHRDLVEEIRKSL
jgi:hypothetical protein